MKLLHCADLHLGKRLGCFDLLPDQRIILQEILSIAADAKVQAILLAGDVYDKPDPPAAAMAVFSDFAARLHEAGIALYLISGNHDSSRRPSWMRSPSTPTSRSSPCGLTKRASWWKRRSASPSPGGSTADARRNKRKI